MSPILIWSKALTQLSTVEKQYRLTQYLTEHTHYFSLLTGTDGLQWTAAALITPVGNRRSPDCRKAVQVFSSTRVISAVC